MMKFLFHQTQQVCINVFELGQLFALSIGTIIGSRHEASSQKPASTYVHTLERMPRQLHP